VARFLIRRSSPLAASACFARLSDWDAHSAAIPGTTLRHEGQPRAGQRFVARTSLARVGLDRIGFDDPMEVTSFRPPGGDTPGAAPGEVSVAKLGRVVAGTVRWTVTPLATGAEVVWKQELRVPWLPGFADPLVGRIGRLAYTAGLRRILAGTGPRHG
jgi:hypothetical protein